MLSDSEPEPDNLQLTINEHYAKAYAYKKEREELERLKDKYGSDPEESDEDDSEGDESEDEDGEELTLAVDAAILRTLARIKRKDPDIYDKDKSIFEQEHQRGGQIQRSKPTPRPQTKLLTIKQHALSSILSANSRSPSPTPHIITRDQEQNALRSETISAFHNAFTDDDGDGLLIPREKTKDEVEQEEEAYRAFIEREIGEDIKNLVTVEEDRDEVQEKPAGKSSPREGEEQAPEEKTKKNKKGKGKGTVQRETDQEFLMNFILNRGWIDRSSKRVPTYKEVTDGVLEGVPQDSPTQDKSESEPDLSEEDDFEEIVDRFESSYNFRFEEPDAAVIQTHPRNIDSAVRRQDTTRKDARDRRKQRKEQALLKKKEEVKRLKALKMKELRQKIEKIGREGGVEIDPQAFAEFDLDGDWDPEKHDNQMAELYTEEGQEDTEKPQWDNDIDISDIVADVTAGPSAPRQKRKPKKKNDDILDDGVNVDAMDADAPLERDEVWDGSEEMRKRKAQEYMDQMYSMDFNDMVGDLPTRFKYTNVAAHSYALTPAEILLATDTELNEYIGVKKFAPYRKDGRWDARRAGRLKEFKAKLKQRSWSQEDANHNETTKAKKRKGKKERQRAKVAEEREPRDGVVGEGEPPRKKQRLA